MSMLGNLLGGIGQGLRAGSGVLNEQVFQNNEAMRQNQMQAAEARKAQMFEYVWQGVQSGSIQPQQGLQAMAQIDPAATQQIVSTLGGAVGPSLKAQIDQEKYLREGNKLKAQEEAAGQFKDPLAQALAKAGSLRAAMEAERGEDGAKPYSKQAKLKADFDAGRLTREEYVAALRQANYVRPPAASGASGDSGFGKGLEGQAYNTLLEVQRYKAAGRPIPQDLQARAEVATHILSQERIVVGSDGQRMAYTPGLPGFAKDGSAPADGNITTPGGGSLAPVMGKSDDMVNVALDTISGIADILNNAEKEGETITGVVGTAKRYGGGLARQAGVPVKPNAERLSKELQRLQAVVGPKLLSDTRLSNDERKRVQEIVGDVNPRTDTVALRQSLADLAAILEKKKAAKATGGVEVLPDGSRLEPDGTGGFIHYPPGQ